MSQLGDWFMDEFLQAQVQKTQTSEIPEMTKDDWDLLINDALGG